MNVDILKDNPDWRWFLLTGAVLVSITIGSWVFLPRDLVPNPPVLAQSVPISNILKGKLGSIH